MANNSYAGYPAPISEPEVRRKHNYYAAKVYLPDQGWYGLSIQEEQFCRALMTKETRGSALNAFKLVYPGSAKAAKWSQIKHATEIFNRPKIQARLKQLREEASIATSITANTLIREELCIALASEGDLYDSEGNIIPIHQLPDRVQRAISSVEITETDPWYSKDGGVAKPGKKTVRVKFWDKGQSLERLEKIMGMFEKDNIQKADTPILIQSVILMLKHLPADFRGKILEDLEGRVKQLPESFRGNNRS